jgi:CheY-like chemotaxis protein
VATQRDRNLARALHDVRALRERENDMAEPRRVVVVHWKPAEIPNGLRQLDASGYATTVVCEMSPALQRRWREQVPDAVVIDLSRLPSHGRAVAVALRETAATRRVPIVFVGGEPGKVDRARQVLPDAAFACWRGIRGALKRALASPPADPVVPSRLSSGYSATPLPRKLGIKPHSTVVLVGPPDGFLDTLGQLPEAVRIQRGAASPGDLTVWFVRRRADYLRALPAMQKAAARGPLWIAWPKQGSALAEDLAQPFIRERALAAGLVDYKVCAIDADWSGIAVRVRRTPRAE